MASAEQDEPFPSLRRQVENIEEANRRAGYPVPESALICLPYPEARALLDVITPKGPTVPDAPASTCGGCRGLGSHRRYCKNAVGWQAARWGLMSMTIDQLADSVGANEPGAANHLYSAASLLRTLAAERAQLWQQWQKQQVPPISGEGGSDEGS